MVWVAGAVAAATVVAIVGAVLSGSPDVETVSANGQLGVREIELAEAPAVATSTVGQSSTLLITGELTPETSVEQGSSPTTPPTPTTPTTGIDGTTASTLPEMSSATGATTATPDTTATTERGESPATDPPPVPGPTQTIALSLSRAEIPAGESAVIEAWSSGYLPVFLSAGPSDICSLDTITVRGRRAGRCTVTAESPGNDEYDPASQSLTVDVVGKAPAFIRIAAPGLMKVGTSGTVTATSTASGATITITASGPCELQGSEIVLLAEGSCTITASHPETAYARAATAQVWISIQGLQLPDVTAP